MQIKIAYLKDHPDEIPALAKIWQEVLGSIWAPDIPIERVEQRFRAHLNDDLLPITLIAFDGTKLVGSVSLRENDGIRPGLMPWLGSLIVDKSYQKFGIGKMLIEATKQKAALLGFKNYTFLHLIQPSPLIIKDRVLIK